MTFALVFARPDLGFVAADTRLVERYWGPRREDRSARVLSDDMHKVIPLCDGWLLSALPPDVTAALEPELLSILGVTWIGRALLSSGPLLDRADVPPEWTHRLREGAVWALWGAADGIGYRAWTLAGTEYTSPPGGEVGFALPPGADDSEAVDLIIGFRDWLLDTTPTLPPILRRTAALLREIHRRCGPEGAVSGSIEIGLLELAGERQLRHRYLLPIPSGIVAAASDATLEAMLQTLGESDGSVLGTEDESTDRSHDVGAQSRGWFRVGETAVQLFAWRGSSPLEHVARQSVAFGSEAVQDTVSRTFERTLHLVHDSQDGAVDGGGR